VTLPAPLLAQARHCRFGDPATTAAAVARLLVEEELVPELVHERFGAPTEDVVAAIVATVLEQKE
jgi:hypothetical protein